LTSAAGTLTHNWRAIWLVSAAASVTVLVLFLLTFTDEEPQPVVEVTSTEMFPLEAQI
jgi:hypothetical protein